MDKHTKEPWSASPEHNGKEWGINAGKWGIAICADAPGDGTAEGNARRIIACVNACAGKPTELLEHVAEFDAAPDDAEWVPPHPIFNMAREIDKLRADLVALSMERDMRRMAEQSNAKLIAELAEAKKSADFNFEQYQDAGRLLFEVCEQRDLLLAVLKELLSGQTIEGLRGQNGMMDICVTGEDVRAGLEAIAAVDQPKACAHAKPILQHTGDGTPVEFCPDCGRNEVAGRAHEGGDAPAADWIEWKGGECPVAEDIMVMVTYRDGEVGGPFPANQNIDRVVRDAGPAFWRNERQANDIIAYRVVQGGAS